MNAAMFAVGETVLYNRTGVCRVEGIGTPPFQKNDGLNYYTLRSVFSTSGEQIYVPVEAMVSMRPLVDSKAVSSYLEMIPQLTPEIFHSKKPSDLAMHYQELLIACDLKDALLLMKEIYLKQATSKKLGQVDARYLKIAERMVCEEFAFILGTSPDLIRMRLYAVMRQEVSG